MIEYSQDLLENVDHFDSETFTNEALWSQTRWSPNRNIALAILERVTVRRITKSGWRMDSVEEYNASIAVPRRRSFLAERRVLSRFLVAWGLVWVAEISLQAYWMERTNLSWPTREEFNLINVSSMTAIAGQDRQYREILFLRIFWGTLWLGRVSIASGRPTCIAHA